MSPRIARGAILVGHLTGPAVRTARGAVAGRPSAELVLFDADGAFGVGEASPIPGFSGESMEDVVAALSGWIERCPHPIEETRPGLEAVEALVGALPPVPSARFALETALLDLLSRRAAVPAWSFFVPEAAPRRLSALLTADDPRACGEEAAALAARGFATLKLKIGAGPADAARLASVRRAAPEVRLRLDANGGGGLTLEALIERLREVEPALELVEEPTSLEVLLERRPFFSVALDESLLSPAGRTRALELAGRGRVSAFVLKPALLGGALPARRLAAEAQARGVGALVTHALDGPVGHAAAAHLAWTLAPSAFADGLALHAGLARVASALSYVEGARLVPARAPGLVPTELAQEVAARAEPRPRRGRGGPVVAPASERDALSFGTERDALSFGTERDALSFLAAAEAAPTRVALIDEHGAAHTFAALAPRVARVSAMLREGGEAEPHALVGVPRLAEVVVALALLEARCPIVWIHPRAVQAEQARILEETGARLVDPRALLAGVRPTRGSAGSSRLPSPSPAAVLFTSGSSGRPKAALLGRSALLAAGRAVLERLGVAEDDRSFLGMPLAHVGGFSVLTRAILARQTVVLGRGERFDAPAMAALFASERITLASMVPTMLHRLLEEPTFSPGALRTILLGGAAASSSLLARATARGFPVRTTYGMTETCAAATLGELGDLEGVGTPLRGVELEVGASGTIRVRGPTLMSGYLRAGAGEEPGSRVDPARDAEGWFDTGDFGSIDERGRVSILARRTDLIVSGGENVYPAEVEAALESFPAIARACVFGIEDEAWGARVCAALVLREPLDEAALTAHLRSTLAAHKRPTSIAELPALPELASGKIDRLRARLEAGPRLRSFRRSSEPPR